MSDVNKATWNCYYVNNDEVLALIKMWREAVGEKRSRIQGQLVSRLSYLVFSKIRGYKEQPYYYDLLQEGRLALAESIEKFDILRGKNFFKLANWRIQKKVKMHLNWQKKVNREVYVYSNDNAKHINPYDILENKEYARILWEAIDRLPEMYRTVVIKRFGVFGSEWQTFKQIGDGFSLTRQRIEQIEKCAISKLKNDIKLKNLYGCEKNA